MDRTGPFRVEMRGPTGPSLFSPLNGIEQTFLFLSQFHSESPPKYCRAILRLGMTALRKITASFSTKGTRQT